MGVGTRVLVIMFCINMMLLVFGFNNLPFQSSLYTQNYNATNDTYSYDSNSGGMGMLNNTQGISSNPLTGWFNALAMVYDTVLIILGLFFAPIMIFMAVPNIPGFIILLVGSVYVVMYAMAIMAFIRGVDF